MKLLFVPLVIVSCFYFSGCGGNANAESLLPESEIELLHRSNFIANGSFTIKQIKVLSSTDRYHSELLSYSSEDPSDINFSNDKVLLIDMGERNSGGYSVSLDNSRLLIDDDSVTVTVILTFLGSNCITTDSITNPYAFYRVPTQKELLIQEELVIENCN
jgi:hypothetical protein